VFWIVVLVVAVWAALAWAHRRGAFRRAALAIAMLAAAVLSIVVVLVAADPTGAGGGFDCWPTCSTYQQAVSWAYVAAPAAVVAVGVAAAGRALALLVARRGRRTQIS
jgi:hypothetical protein